MEALTDASGKPLWRSPRNGHICGQRRTTGVAPVEQVEGHTSFGDQVTGGKGGADARKGKGRPHAFTGEERNWIEQALKRLIWRASEVAHNPASAYTQITMADLPKL
jgi:hypothetical protein